MIGGPEFCSTSTAELRDAVAQWTVPHMVFAREGRVDGSTRALALGHSALVYVRYGGDVLVEATPAGSRFAITLPLGPMTVGHARLADHGVCTSSVLLERTRRTLMVPDPLAGALVVAVDLQHLERHLVSVLGHEVDDPLDLDPGTGICSVLPIGFLDGVVRTTWWGVTGTTLLAAGAARVLEESLLTAVLLGLPHNHSARLAEEPTDRATIRARTARDWLEAHYAEPVGVVDLARALGVSVRHVQVLFAREHHTTPTAMLTGIRLRRAHQLFTESGGQQLTVTEVAHRCGVTHLGRFASAYRRRFGELPSASRPVVQAGQ